MIGITPFRSVLLTLTCSFAFLVFLAWPSAQSVHSGAFLLVAALVQAVLLSAPVLLLMALHARLLRKGHNSRLLAIATFLLAVVTVVFLLANYKLQQMFGFERPRIGPVKDQMRANIARLLGCDLAVVNVKGKSHEKVDAVGEGRAIEAHVVVLLQQA